MAQYQHLPLYKTTYDLLVELMHATKNFPKDFKYSLGEKIQNQTTGILIDIYRANGMFDKQECIKKILEDVQFLEVYLRLSHDLKIITVEKYAIFIEKTNSISKQAQGWLQAYQSPSSRKADGG